MNPLLGAGLIALIPLRLPSTEDPNSTGSPPPPRDEPPAGATGADEQDEARTGEDLLELDKVVVTGSRGPREIFDLPRSVTLVDDQELHEKNKLVALDALDERIGVWVEKRNGMSSDPVIRGLSGGNVLALIDGNSLTTLWGEGGYAGDDMYGKVDAESIARIEVVRGPSSVLYGSNALGGVINFITAGPPLPFADSGFDYGGRLKTSYASSSDAFMGRGDVWGATPEFRYRLGFTARDVHDVKGGGNLGFLSPSGGQDYNWDLNSEIALGERDFLEVSSQLINRNNVPKYYRPTQMNYNARRALNVTWRREGEDAGDSMKWTVYGQDKKDVRVWNDQEKRGVARWQSLSTDFQASTALGEGDHELTWGVHLNVDEGESPDDEQFTITTPATGEQKASPDSTWTNAGAYLQDEWFLNDDWSVVASARVDWFRYKTDDNLFWTIPGSTSDNNRSDTAGGSWNETSLTGGLGVVRYMNPDWTMYGSWSRGYRLFPPGFGYRRTGYGILAPTSGLLDPIVGDQFEIGTRAVGDWWSTSIAVYHTLFSNFQEPKKTDDQIDWDGEDGLEDDEYVWVVDDDVEGNVSGIEVETAVDLSRLHDRLENWTWLNGFMVNSGDLEFADGDEPLRHTHPPRWLSTLRYQNPESPTHGWFEMCADIVDRYDDISNGRLNGDVGYLDDPQDPDSGLLRTYGLPGYTVYDIRGGLDVAKGVSLIVALENIFDKKYRTAHSRMDAAGRTVIVGLEIRR